MGEEDEHEHDDGQKSKDSNTVVTHRILDNLNVFMKRGSIKSFSFDTRKIDSVDILLNLEATMTRTRL